MVSAAAMHAIADLRPHEDRGRGRAGSETRPDRAANLRRRAHRCIRSSRSGISPRCSIRSGFDCFSLCRVSLLQFARRARFEWAAFDQRIGPLAQSRNVNVDPVIPPVERGGVIGEGFTLVGNQCLREFLYVLGYKIMLIEQDEWLEEFNQFFYF